MSRVIAYFGRAPNVNPCSDVSFPIFPRILLGYNRYQVFLDYTIEGKDNNNRTTLPSTVLSLLRVQVG